jgi:hypothetical protein
MIKSSFWGKALGTALLLALAAPASAKVYQLGDLVAKTSSSVSSGPSANRYNVSGNRMGRFRDSFRFSLSKNADVNLRSFLPNGRFGKNVERVRFTVRDGGGNLIARLGGGKRQNFADALGDGNYTVRVRGSLKDGFARGAYKLSAVAIAAPVPEPEEWAMMILGSGMLAYQIRRKQRKLAADDAFGAALPA